MSKFQDLFFNVATSVADAREAVSTFERSPQQEQVGLTGEDGAKGPYASPKVSGKSDGGDSGAVPGDKPTGRSVPRVPAGCRLPQGYDFPPELGGRSYSRVDPRKYKYDAVRASTYALNFTVTRDDRMPVAEACDKLEQIREKCGVVRGEHDDTVVAAFDTALWFCHTVNSASRLNPGRSKFSVPGHTQEFNYLDILQMLGADARRFFRTYADDIADVNRRVLLEHDPYDVVSTERWAWLMDVAVKRNISKYPYLAHDSAEACLHLTMSERAALAASKSEVLGKAEQDSEVMEDVVGKGYSVRSSRLTENWRKT